MVHKILIATPVDFSNFGNRLQNYAVHRICEKLGLEPVTLAVEYAYIKNIVPKHSVLQLINALRLGKVFSSISKLKAINKSVTAWKFTKAEIKTEYVKNEDELNRALENAEYFGIGGDQILAPYWRNIIWFATFPGKAPDHKICFAPSFGSDTLPEEYEKDTIMPEIRLITHLAVREQSGCAMIEQCIGKKVLRICDPVVLLTKENWQRSAEKYSVNTEKPYILFYFLGDVKKSYCDFIEKESKKKGYKIIDVSKKSLSDEASCNPMEFVSYIQSAEYIYTDSFHAIMLALVLNRKVVIFERAGGEEMNTRVLELVKRYELNNCVFSESISDQRLDTIGKYDIDLVNQVLYSERAIADEYYNRFKQ